MPFKPDADTHLTTLANGVRVLTLHRPHLLSANVSVFVRSGSAHETDAQAGISHMVEHMVFKGTRTRDRRRINLDAEALGADANAHTDKDHTAFHLRGLARHARPFVRMLGDLVLQPTFPADELDRERQVVLAEMDEDEDDPMSTAFKLFDKACYGRHPVGRAVIGQRRRIEAFTRDDLDAYFASQYTGANLVVAAAGPLDPQAIAREAERVFGRLRPGDPNLVPTAAYAGGLATRQVAGTGQAHAVVGFALPARPHNDVLGAVAAAVLGEGMSSPLMERLREQLGLVYYAACSADVFDMAGQFVIEASMAPDRLDQCLGEIALLLKRHSRRVDPQDLDRARHQIAVRRLRAEEEPARMLEDAALDLFSFGRVRTRAERAAQWKAVTPEAVSRAFKAMLASGATVAVTGQLGRGVRERVRERMAGVLRAN
jgi:predicted Zn-dependent peptidase